MTPVRPETMVHRHGTLPARVSREERWVWTGIGGCRNAGIRLWGV